MRWRAWTAPPQRTALDAKASRHTSAVDTTETAPLDLAAIAAPHVTPVLGRYMDRSWARGEGHRLYDTAGRGYLDFANGIAVTVAGPRASARDGRDPRAGRPADAARPTRWASPSRP